MPEDQQHPRRIWRESQPRDAGKRPPAGSPPLAQFGPLLLVAIFAVAVFALATRQVSFPPLSIPNFLAPAPAQPPTVLRLERAYDAQFLEYHHPVYGFRVKYPVGYMVTASDFPPDVLKFSAFSPGGLPVIARFVVSNETFGDREFSQFVSSMPANDQGTAFTLLSSGKQAIGGRTVYVANSTQVFGPLGEKLYVTNAFFDCGSYRVMMETETPESSRGEQLVFTAMLESFTC